jgi:hypothetical protein
MGAASVTLGARDARGFFSTIAAASDWDNYCQIRGCRDWATSHRNEQHSDYSSSPSTGLRPKVQGTLFIGMFCRTGRRPSYAT